MKSVMLLLVFFTINSFAQQEENSLIVTISKDNLKQMNENQRIPKEEAFQMNIGFDDNPVWVWAKYDHNYSWNDAIHNHIYGINYWDEQGNIESMYYELDRESKMKYDLDFSDYILKPYSGDRTLQLIGKNGDTLLLFNVLENKKFRRNFKGKSYQRIPTVNLNHNKEKVTDFDVEINLTSKKDNLYEATIIGNEGINEYLFKSNAPINEEIIISYYDLTNNKIYLIQKGCYLEKIDL